MFFPCQAILLRRRYLQAMQERAAREKRKRDEALKVRRAGNSPWEKPGFLGKTMGKTMEKGME
jgi:hypothetical protein